MQCSDRKFIMALALLSIPIFMGCGNSEKNEMPITTNSPEARKFFIKGLALYEKLRENEAREYFSQALEKDMDFALCNFYLADLATSALEFQTHLKLAIALAPKTSPGEQLLIGSMRALAENNPGKAIELRKKLVELYPKDKRAHRFLGYLYRNRDENLAIEEFKKAIKIDKNYAPAYNNLGYAYRRLGQYEKAIEAFKKYMRLLPDEPNPYDSIADLYTKMGKHKEAIKYYKKAVKLNKAFAFSQRKIGENLIFLDQYEQGRKAFEKALNLSTSPAEKINTMLMYATSFVYENQYDRALLASKRAMQTAKNNNLPEWQAEVYLFRIMINLENNTLEEASNNIQACKTIFQNIELPSSTTEKYLKNLLYFEGCVAAKRGDFGTAFAIAESLKAKIAEYQDPWEMENYHRLMGFINHEKGHQATAVAHFRQGDSNDPYSLYLWAECEAALGNEVEARKLYEKVAHWNESSLPYALVRSKAINILKKSAISQR